MLPALYIAEGEGCWLKVNEVCFESGCPGTTALRWLIKLEELRMVRRRQNPLDARSSFVEIEGEGITRMTRYLLAAS